MHVKIPSMSVIPEFYKKLGILKNKITQKKIKSLKHNIEKRKLFEK